MITTEFNGISNWQSVISLHQWLSEESLSLAHGTQSRGGKLWVNTPHLEKPDPTVSTTLHLGENCSVSGGGGLVANSWDPHGEQLARLLCPWDSPGKNTGVG